MPPTSSFDDRLVIGSAATQRLIAMLTNYGLTVVETGQEQVLDKTCQLLRYRYDRTATFVRHFPDLLCMNPSIEPFYAEVKSTSKKHWDSPNFSIETKSLQVCQFLDHRGIHAAIFFENRPSEFYVDWADNIEAFHQSENVKRYDGSATPMNLVHKNSLHSAINKKDIEWLLTVCKSKQ